MGKSNVFQEEVILINTSLTEKPNPYKNNSHKKKIADIEKNIYEEKLKEEFFNNISHDIKTPITIIMGYAQLLKEEYYSSNGIHTIAIDYIESESKKLNSIVDDIIEKAKYSKY